MCYQNSLCDWVTVLDVFKYNEKFYFQFQRKRQPRIENLAFGDKVLGMS